MSESRTSRSSPRLSVQHDNPASTEARDGHSESIAQAFEQFKNYIDTRLENLTDTLQSIPRAPAEDHSIAQTSTRKLQREAEAQKLKYKANSKQFLHNSEVEEHVASTIHQLEKENPDREQALEAAKAALVVIKKRQKLIKLADKSEAGWLAVQEYESDELADDSEDEKRIKKAQDKAARKKKQSQQAKNKRPRANPPVITNLRPEDRQLFRGNCPLSLYIQGLFA